MYITLNYLVSQISLQKFILCAVFYGCKSSSLAQNEGNDYDKAPDNVKFSLCKL